MTAQPAVHQKRREIHEVKHKEERRPQEVWGSFRLSVVGQLLASPPAWGKLDDELKKLAEREWKHPLTGEPVWFKFSTIEQWYYQAKAADQSPMRALSGKLRSDSGQFRALTDPVSKPSRPCIRRILAGLINFISTIF